MDDISLSVPSKDLSFHAKFTAVREVQALNLQGRSELVGSIWEGRFFDFSEHSGPEELMPWQTPN